MSEKDTERKGRRFWPWPLDEFWLVPWAVVSLCWLHFLFSFNLLPLCSPCKSHLDNLLVFLDGAGLFLAGVAPFLGAVLARWALRRRGLHRIWCLLGAFGLVLSVAGILAVWQSMQYIDESSECRALGDCRNISTAILLFHKDTGEWPYYCSPFDDPDRKPCIDYLYGNMGDMPDLYKPAWETWGTVSDDTYFHLVTNGRERPLYRPALTAVTGPGGSARGWKGPYLPYVTDDPWGHKYFASVGAFEGGRLKSSYVWCISAGPNECLETPTTAPVTQGDDIGYRTTGWPGREP